jgi:hypothetical protein
MDTLNPHAPPTPDAPLDLASLGGSEARGLKVKKAIGGWREFYL